MNTISFKASYIDNAVIQNRCKDKTFVNKDVAAVKLSVGSYSDFESLRRIHYDWSLLDKESLTEGIFYDFTDYLKWGNKRSYIALTTQPDNFHKLNPNRILGIIEYTHDKSKKYDYIDYIQVNPKYMSENKNRDMKGIGSALLEVIKNRYGYKNIYLNAINNAVDFYIKNGFEIVQKNLEEPLMLFVRTGKYR